MIVTPEYSCVFLQNTLLLLLLLHRVIYNSMISHTQQIENLPTSIIFTYNHASILIYIIKSAINRQIKEKKLCPILKSFNKLSNLYYVKCISNLSIQNIYIYEATILCVPRSILSDYVLNAMCDIVFTSTQQPSSAINASSFHYNSLSFLSYSIQSSYPHLRWKDGILTKRNQR